MEKPSAGFVFVDQDVITANSLISEALNDPGATAGLKHSIWKSVDRSNVVSNVFGFGGTWSACDEFRNNSTHFPKDQEDAEDRQIAAEDQMFEQLQGAFDVPNALQFSGPVSRTADHGVSQMLAPCTHPGHPENNGRFF